METISGTPSASELAERVFGHNVRSHRIAAGLTQAELADKLMQHGVLMRQSMVAKIERGARPTSIGELRALSDVLGVPVSRLLSSDEEVPREVNTLVEMRRQAQSTAAELEELLEQKDLLERRIEGKRALLQSSARLYDKTLAIVTENRGADWLASQGMEVASLAAQDERFLRLGAYGDAKGPEDPYVHAQLNAGLI